MPTPFLTPDQAYLFCNIEMPTAYQETILQMLCQWADPVLIALMNGADPRTDPAYEGQTFSDLSLVAGHLVAREFYRINSQSHGIDESTLGNLSVKNTKAPDISSLMETILQRYRLQPMGA